jgi:hypothetical protein
MKVSEIIGAEYKKLGKDPAKFLFGLNQLVQSQDAKIFQEGDTLLVVIRMGNNQAQVDLYTQDSPLKINAAVGEMIKKLKASGISAIYGSQNSQLPQILQSLSINVAPSDNPNYQWMAQL